MREKLGADFGGIVIYLVSVIFMICWSIFFCAPLYDFFESFFFL